MHRVDSRLHVGELDLLLCVQLTKLLLLLVEFFRCATTLFTNHEVTVTLILNPSLLNSIDLYVLRANVILELGYLPLQVLNHLLSSFQNLLLRIVVRMGTMKLGLFLFKLQLHLRNVLKHALHLEIFSLEFTLDASLGAFLIFKILCRLNEHFVLLELD